MLDTDTVSFAIRGVGRIGEHIVSHRPSEICISAITLAELRFGAEWRNSQKLRLTIEAFARNITIAAFDEACAETFGLIGAKLAARGTRIGELDTMIAAHALTLGVILVTNNTKHFDRIDGLETVNWL